jgi:2-polyprenyl-3-methyl-5-hydroxy-6-metoxy-1,4-benzoquinol methylase
LESRTCNICGASVDRDRDLRWRKDGYDVLRCPACGTHFRADLPTSDALQAIYGPAYFSASAGETDGQGYADYLGEEPNHRANAVRRLELLERERGPGRLLDVGCAAGFFLDEARKRGWSVTGVELAAGMAEHARDRLGLDVRLGAFADAELEPGAFDAITMWDYLEHSTDPTGDLRHAASLLAPGGLLAVSTGDVASLAARVSGSRWHLLTPRHHNFFFTRASLERAFRDAGFEVVSSRHLSSRYSLHYLLHKLRTLRDLALLRRLSYGIGRTRLGSLAVPVNLFDIVTLVGRRS